MMPVWICNNELSKGSEVVIFDLDGVISDAAHRQHFLKGTERDWDGFFSACTEDPPIISGVKLINVLNKYHKTIILTARPSSVQSKTVHWLKRHSVVWDVLIMRSDDDHRQSSEMKLTALNQIRDAGYDPVLVFDDDPKNIAMFLEQEVPAISVHSGYYA
ncbi:MAG: HAD family acid phosphatase [Actinomycetota bacterium]|nr:HAD family acid phosphatase [Actinomycetota bacterium]MEC7607200.1 HAD family acid phosphatase [Actinomycetota bacterium]MEC8118532.1 HAD family acid phosphatase [Actinomycetota bacterium]MEC8334114.1 HAD family acid phosphatase [Actinomycetota bacterium]MEC8392750.1 HAD family acid phosphatase [Actinomycetota bacterium]